MNTKIFLTLLKGAPLSVFICMLLNTDNPEILFTETFLASQTGYSVKTIRAACSQLSDLSLVKRKDRYTGYILIQIPAAFSLPSTTATIVESNTFNEYEEKVEEDFTARAVKFTAPQQEVYSLLRSKNVGEPTRARLTLLPWATLDYINSHFCFGEKNDDPLGLIIHRIKSHDEAPKVYSEIEGFRRSWLH
jgi:hypothetical protein